MDPRNYSRLAAIIYAIVAVLQLVRVVLAWDITLNGVPIPLQSCLSVEKKHQHLLFFFCEAPPNSTVRS